MRTAALMTVLLLVPTLGACGPGETIQGTAPPEVGTVTARVVSSFGVDVLEPGIGLPSGLQVFVADGTAQPLPDAEVRVHPDGVDPRPMVHKGGGRYELDVLSERMAPPASIFFFEVRSELLEPERTVLEVAHAFLAERPEIGEPAERSEHVEGEAITVMWYPVVGADCYDVGVREHELQSWTWVHECVETTTAVLAGEIVDEISLIRVRARRGAGDETFVEEAYYTQSTSSTDVRIFLVRPGA